MRASDTAQIFFEGVRVPKRNRIGDEGKGFVYQMMQFQEERLWAARGLPQGARAYDRRDDRLRRAQRRRSAAVSSTIRRCIS